MPSLVPMNGGPHPTFGLADGIKSADAAPALAVGCFREALPPPFLRNTFACCWVHRMPATGVPPVTVMPDGTIDLQWIDGTFRVAGPDKEPQIELLPANSMVIGFRFRPGAAAAWLGVPANEMVGRRLALDELWGARGRQLAGAVRSRGDLAGLVTSLENVIAACTAEHADPDTPMRAAYELIENGPPPGVALVPWLGRALAMSERTLRRRFDESFGYGPKTLDRILRYQRFLRLLRQSQGPTAMLATEVGYADQAHLVRESRRLTGSTPLQFARMLNGGGPLSQTQTTQVML